MDLDPRIRERLAACAHAEAATRNGPLADEPDAISAARDRLARTLCFLLAFLTGSFTLLSVTLLTLAAQLA